MPVGKRGYPPLWDCQDSKPAAQLENRSNPAAHRMPPRAGGGADTLPALRLEQKVNKAYPVEKGPWRIFAPDEPQQSP